MPRHAIPSAELGAEVAGAVVFAVGIESSARAVAAVAGAIGRKAAAPRGGRGRVLGLVRQVRVEAAGIDHLHAQRLWAEPAAAQLVADHGLEAQQVGNLQVAHWSLGASGRLQAGAIGRHVEDEKQLGACHAIGRQLRGPPEGTGVVAADHGGGAAAEVAGEVTRGGL